LINIGSRTVWTPVPNLDLSVEAVYSKVDQNLVGTVVPTNTGYSHTLDDFDQWTFMFRVQRNFWP
jgi:hypothetical protein